MYTTSTNGNLNRMNIGGAEGGCINVGLVEKINNLIFVLGIL